jgi:hypothetical protein
MRSAITKLLTFALLLVAAPAWAVCTQHGAVGITSTQIVADRDIKPRSYVLVENSGTVEPIWIAIGSKNNATIFDIFLKPGASWLMTAMNGANLPSGDIAVISIGTGSSYAFCDY